MKTVGVYEAKTHLPRLLDEVEQGEVIVITKHGVPVAQLTPVLGSKRINVKSVINELRSLRQEISLAGLSVREMIEEGRQ